MIVFCTHCWHECDSSDRICPNCKADLTLDTRSYNQKLIAALQHPLPEARVRTCWLIGLNSVNDAASKLIDMAEHDPDLFVRRAAVQTLGKLHSQEAIPVLEKLAAREDHWTSTEAKISLDQMQEKNDAVTNSTTSNESRSP